MHVARLEGLLAATLTPFNRDGSLRLAQIEPIVEHLISDGASGLYICGSTGEGISLDDDERKQVAERYVRAASGRVKTVVQVGHNSLAAARGLAAHAQAIGADAISATCPSYFEIDRVETLADAMANVAMGAPQLPFYYYHIPVRTSANFEMSAFTKLAAERIENFAGLKFTSPSLHQFQYCLELDDRRFDCLWGLDEMLLGALAVDARGAVGSTYNVAAPLGRQIIDAWDDGDLQRARLWQLRLIELIRVLMSFPFLAALKETLRRLGTDCGPCRLPLSNLSAEDAQRLHERLEAIRFYEWRKDLRTYRRVDAPVETAGGRHSPSNGQGEALERQNSRIARPET
jgi:N-acetylneuraminate lyase